MRELGEEFFTNQMVLLLFTIGPGANTDPCFTRYYYQKGTSRMAFEISAWFERLHNSISGLSQLKLDMQLTC
jgi:hypothetical protein